MVIDNQKKILDDKIKRAKDMNNPVSALPLLKFLVESKDELTDEQRKELGKILKESATQLGKVLLDRALADGTLTDKEWLDFQELGFDIVDISAVLQGFYSRKDKILPRAEDDFDDDLIVIISHPDYPQYIHRDKIKEKFDVEVIALNEVNEFMRLRKEMRES